MEEWRLIYEDGLPAARNMAADAYLLEQAEKGETCPVIRIYGWAEPSITIGYHQQLQRAVDVARLGKTPVVKRITGGRALLHDDHELTYAVAGNYIRFGCLGEELSDSYRLIAQAIIIFYRGCGWEAEMARRDRPVSLAKTPSIQKGCFAAVSQYEITYNGAKVAAGSQRRTRCAFMQHGSIKLAIPQRHPAISDISQDIVSLPSPAISGDRDRLAMRLAGAFEQVYLVNLIIRPFSGQELREIGAKMKEFENLNVNAFSIEQDRRGESP